MNINKTVENGSARIALEGRLDTVTAPELERELEKLLPGVNEMTLDFTELQYISSAGLRVLKKAHTQLSKKGGLRIANPNEIVRDVFEATGFNALLHIVP